MSNRPDRVYSIMGEVEVSHAADISSTMGLTKAMRRKRTVRAEQKKHAEQVRS